MNKWIIRQSIFLTYKNLSEVSGRVTVSIGGLHDADVNVFKASGLDEIHNEHGGKASNFVTIKEAEGTIFIWKEILRQLK